MFCNQCEQAARGTGCDVMGVCGKDPQVAALQDLILYQAKGISFLAKEVREKGEKTDSADLYIVEALFSIVTNVNFDFIRLKEMLTRGENVASELVKRLQEINPFALEKLPEEALFHPAVTDDNLVKQAAEKGILSTHPDEDIRSLQQILIYGLKGMAAYTDHARILGKTDDRLYVFFHKALAYLTSKNPEKSELIGLCMECGEKNVIAMQILDEAHTSRFGHPVPTPVSTSWCEGPAIVVSGHDLLDLEELLKQTEGTGVNVYTHGEMLPAHGYPGLKKYEHLIGHFGTAWQNQQREFDGVNAVFLFTTNCIQKPKTSYFNNVFTTGLVGWPGVHHVKNRDFSPVIARAKELGSLTAKEGITLTTGFARNAVLGVADKVIEAVKSGAIRHFFLVGGCDGAKAGRNYYTEFVEKTPKDTVVLTLACGKFRFNYLDLGDIGGIPRLLDIGQCNDAFSAVKIAEALAGAFQCGINDLPLSIVLSWYEQKAVAVLLSLLSLGVKNIRIGPSLPAFVSPGVLSFLNEQFGIRPIGTAKEDLEEILGVSLEEVAAG